MLRGLVYALIIQAIAAFSTWLPILVHKVKSNALDDHLSALAVYGLVVCIAAPTVVGLLLGSWLRSAESGGPLRWWHYALGGRDVRRAWDSTFSQHNGGWMRIVLKERTAGGPPAILGKYGKTSWAAQSPADPDLYLQEVWPTDDQGQVTEEALSSGSAGGMWINGDQIARIEVLSGD